MSIAVPLCGFGGGGLPKSKIVNNFTTTEEGYVADARALKTLNDSKLSMELLWENDSPASQFDAKTIDLDLSEYEKIEIWVFGHKSQNTAQVFECIVGETAVLSLANSAGSYYKFSISARTAYVSKNAITISISETVSYVDDPATSGDYIIPWKIYGIKGV